MRLPFLAARLSGAAVLDLLGLPAGARIRLSDAAGAVVPNKALGSAAVAKRATEEWVAGAIAMMAWTGALTGSAPRRLMAPPTTVAIANATPNSCARR